MEQNVSIVHIALCPFNGLGSVEGDGIEPSDWGANPQTGFYASPQLNHDDPGGAAHL